MKFDIKNIRIGVIGLGYVGLPLAVEFGKKYPTVGFDVKESRIADLKAGKDATLEVTAEELRESEHLQFTSDVNGIAGCNFFIVTVP
ncbi:MAG: Vi polysaccharide biosynthesis UDP-N-acetylglucosamine C-6 dehydrogenase TviB, partial [Woeseiaceae bacterium]|nr:Vi polysaccharide biosynthesis UDP-N-acetylglucosamine C-6 dehydrogenase TviB [Woeseiaceae bacterium]